jgi:hypothetical protein
MSHLRMLARMGRTTTYTREELAVRLAKHGTPAEVQAALDEAFAIPAPEFKRQLDALAQSIVDAGPVIKAGEGKGPDARGRDEADRVTESIVEGALGLTDPMKRV